MNIYCGALLRAHSSEPLTCFLAHTLSVPYEPAQTLYTFYEILRFAIFYGLHRIFRTFHEFVLNAQTLR